MRFLKNFLFGCLLTISFQYPLKAQDIITTDEIAYVFHHYGVDSALSWVPPFCQLEDLDSALAVSMALHVNLDLRHFEQFLFLNSICSSIKNDSVNAHCLWIVHQSAIQQNEIDHIVPSVLLWIVYQNNPASIPVLTDEFNFWEHKADSIHKRYPSHAKIALQRLNGGSILERKYAECKGNSYKLAWTLYKLGAPGFTLQKADFIKKQPAPYFRLEEMSDYTNTPVTAAVDTLRLERTYAFIKDLIADNSSVLKELKEDYTGTNCRPHLLIKENKALFVINCIDGKVSGSKLMLLEVNGTDQLIVTTLRRKKR